MIISDIDLRECQKLLPTLTVKGGGAKVKYRQAKVTIF